MASKTGFRQRKMARAFTLVELLLTVALMLLLAGAVIIDFGSLDRNAHLEEGAANLETLLRYARAQAASTGRRVKVVFGSQMQGGGGMTVSTNPPPALVTTNSGVGILWEPDALGAPGRFESLPGAELLLEQVNDLVTVLRVRPPSSNWAAATNVEDESLLAMAQAANTNATSLENAAAFSTPPLNCYPDGSSDSVEIILGAANSADKHLAVVSLSGLTGEARHRLMTFTEDGVPQTGTSVQPEMPAQ